MDASLEDVCKILDEEFIECLEVSPQRVGVRDELDLVFDRHDSLLGHWVWWIVSKTN